MPHYLTKIGLKKLQDDLSRLKTSERREVIERIAAAKELGDLKENAEYAEAKDTQAMLESKIAEIEAVLKDAVLIEEDRTGESEFVQVGSRVQVACNGSTCVYTIVGTEEADPAQLKISNESPLGRAFLNKSRGDKVLVRVPRGEFEYMIVEID